MVSKREILEKQEELDALKKEYYTEVLKRFKARKGE